ncbi:MAG TPA: DUF3365 domain-containing protein [Candidatus Methylomirabilis sp.]|nr:DUF3365 domain-containing protein [Candidatus Methylomirabilis sp.]
MEHADRPAPQRGDKSATTHQARRFLWLLCLMLLALTSLSLYLDLRGLDDQYKVLAAEVGRSFFRAIDAMRGWNLDHGGIYMRVGKDILPNPYLPDSLQEVTTTRGARLAMINHAQMTRLLSELLTQERGIHLHIASLTPIRPDNKPDSWEQHALDHFEQGSQEEYEVLADGDGSTFKYMAPLRTQASCLSCHLQHGESSRSIRGGISVSFSYAPFLGAMAGERKRILFMHAMFLGLGLGVVALTGRKLIQSIGALQESLMRIKRLEGFLPICSNCKRIRLEGADEGKQQSWIQIESYIRERTDADFTHGLCPECTIELYPDVFKRGGGPG